jgi:hypothetical protein
MRVAAGIDETWRRLLATGTQRGWLAGYTGTAILEEADDDERVARFRLQGARDGEPATATVTAALAPAGEGTEVEIAVEAFGDAAPDVVRAAIESAAPVVAPADEPASPPPAVVAGPAHPGLSTPAHPGLSAPAKGALVAAGAALAVWALRGRR